MNATIKHFLFYTHYSRTNVQCPVCTHYYFNLHNAQTLASWDLVRFVLPNWFRWTELVLRKLANLQMLLKGTRRVLSYNSGIVV